MSDKDSPPGEKVSFNSRSVLLGLFLLVIFILGVFTYSVNVFPAEQSGRLNTVFIAAVSGILALGGTLISQLWGKNTTRGRPIIYLTSPEDTEVGVSLDSSVVASFNTLMDKSTINSNTFTLKYNSDSYVEGTVRFIGGAAEFNPSNSLKPLTKYTATITKEAKDMTGKSLDSDKIWSFTTAEESK